MSNFEVEVTVIIGVHGVSDALAAIDLAMKDMRDHRPQGMKVTVRPWREPEPDE